ncbi:MAG: hypothetical protein ABJC13_07445 [Acidobacteriota bacterium]
MDDTGLLRDLARAAREEEAEERDLWDRWDRLTDGTLSPEEEAELRALAQSSPEAEQAYEAFRPLSPEFRAKMVAEIGPMIRPSLFIRWRDAFIRWRDAHLVVWRAAYSGSGLASAAAALYFMVSLPAVPLFVVELEPVLAIRGDSTVFTPGGGFKATVWPEKETSSRSQINLRCYIESKSPAAKPLRAIQCVVAERLKTGWMSIQGRLPKDQSIGPSTLWLVFAYSGNQPDLDEVGKVAKTHTKSRDWKAVPSPMEIRAP